MVGRSADVPLQDEVLTWTSQRRTGQPSILAIQVWHHTYYRWSTQQLV